MSMAGPRIAVLLPCFNEASSIARVVADFRAALPGAAIHVCDNASTDDTAAIARQAGALVTRETRRGKGHAVRRLFADIDADIYILADGDDTYDAAAAPRMVAHHLAGGLDLTNGARQALSDGSYRRGHRLGNYVLTRLVHVIFGRQFRDMLSGYKVLSRRFVKSFPVMSSGFEIETELAVHALELRMPCDELPTDYRERGAGSESKLRTLRDGARILALIARLVKDERPLQFFGLAGLAAILLAIGLGVPLVLTFLQTGLVPRLPTALLSVGLVMLGALSFFAGLILQMVTRSRQEMKLLAYLAVPKFPG